MAACFLWVLCVVR